MDVLPRDIVQIVYRLLFDYNYGGLRRQYTAIWLTGPYYWNDCKGTFIRLNSSGRIANWRNLDDRYGTNDSVFSFDGLRRRYNLSACYSYSIGLHRL